MNRQEKIQHYLESLHRSGRDLTPWEKEEFLPSVARQFNAKGDLSDRQLEILERIYDEKTPVGSRFGEPAEEPIQDFIRKHERRYEGFEDNPGRSSQRRGWKERGYDD